MKNTPTASLDDYPVRATVSGDAKSVERLLAALGAALELPAGLTPFSYAMGWSGRGGAMGELKGGLRIVGIKKRTISGAKVEALLASHVAFDASGALVLWSLDHDPDVPGPLTEVLLRDARGTFVTIPDVVRERAQALGLAKAKARTAKKRLARPILVAGAPLWAVGLSPDGARCASVDQSQVLSLWDTLDGSLLVSRKIARAGCIVRAVEHSYDGTRIVAGARPLMIVDASSLETLLELEIPRGGEVCHATWSPDDTCVAAAIGGLRSKNVVVWNARSGQRVASFDHANPQRVAFERDGRRLVATGYGPCARFDLAGATPLETSDVRAPHGVVPLGDGWAVSTESGIVVLDRILSRVGDLVIPGAERGPRLAIDSAQTTLVVGSWTEREIVIVDAHTHAVRARMKLPVVNGIVPSLQGVAISADGSTVAATSGWAVAIGDSIGRLRIVPRSETGGG